MALVPLLPSAFGLRKTTRPISYPSPLILTEEHFPLDLVPICDDDDEETDCEDSVNVTVHLDILSSLHHLLRRIAKQIKTQMSFYEPYFSSAAIFALFFLLIFTVATFNGADSTTLPFGRRNIRALRHASSVNVDTHIPGAYSWVAQGRPLEERYSLRAAYAAGIRSSHVASSPSPVTDDQVQPVVVLSPSGMASAKFRGARSIEDGNSPRTAVRQDRHAHPEDLEKLFNGGRGRG